MGLQCGIKRKKLLLPYGLYWDCDLNHLIQECARTRARGLPSFHTQPTPPAAHAGRRDPVLVVRESHVSTVYNVPCA
eukprot:2069423-Rhodomonas_salina.1